MMSNISVTPPTFRVVPGKEAPMRTIAHIVNPIAVEPPSDLCIAQPITFETMLQARRFAQERVNVQLLTAQYAEDRCMIQPGFERTPDLDRSVTDLRPFLRQRKLPILRDILDRLYAASPQAEYLIYTNVDIALTPGFYLAIDRLLEAGFDALVINRRTLSSRYANVENIPLMWADPGETHPGHDCFIFRREVYPRYRLDEVCIGVNFIGRALVLNLASHAKQFKEFKELHLTFHVGNDQIWKREDYADYVEHNKQATLRAMRSLFGEFPHAASMPDVLHYLNLPILQEFRHDKPRE